MRNPNSKLKKNYPLYLCELCYKNNCDDYMCICVNMCMYVHAYIHSDIKDTCKAILPL